MTRILKPGGWVEVKPCPACGHNDTWCTRTADGEVIKCNRLPSPRPIKQRDGSTAWLHRAAELGAAPLPSGTSAKPALARLSVAELEVLIRQYRTSINPKRLASFAESMGLTVRSLQAYRVGYDAERAAWAFPMYDGRLKPCGIRLRYANGRKACVPGSRNGLFIPEGFDFVNALATVPEDYVADPTPMLLLTPEGPTDCCAAFDLGLRAIGRPSANGGMDMLRQLLESGPKQDVVVVADNDEAKYLPDGTPRWAGIEGALEVVSTIRPACGSIRFFLPPKGVKDLRQCLGLEAEPLEIAVRLNAVKPVDEKWSRRQKARLMQERQAKRRTPELAK